MPILGVAIGAGFVVVTSIGYYFFHPSEIPTKSKSSSFNNKIAVILPSLYIVLTIVLLRFYTYERPTAQYLLFGMYAGIIGFQIARGVRRSLILLQVWVLAFFTYWSSQLMFPAGMYAPDTQYKYLPAIRSVFSSGTIPDSVVIYAGHIAYVSEFSLVTGLPEQLSYYLLATLILTATIFVIGILSNAFRVMSHRVALYAALVFSISSWMLGRGMHPNKLNFFYALILLIMIAAVRMYRSQEDGYTRVPWLVIGLAAAPAIIFGHQFSAGATMIFLFTFAVFLLLKRTLLVRLYEKINEGPVVPFVVIYLLGVIGNPLHQDSLLTRLSNLIVSVVQSQSGGSSTGGPGRYSDLPLDILLTSTAAQTILFALGIIGAIWLFREKEWEYDYVILWMGVISALLVLSLLVNSKDTAPQRFYGFLMLFGFNICLGVLFYQFSNPNRSILPSFLSTRREQIVSVLLCILAITSLASPIAGDSMSPVNDELPHFRTYNTHQLEHSQNWVDRFATSNVRGIVPASPEIENIPIKQTSEIRGEADLASLSPGELYLYSDLANKSGVVATGGITLGSRIFVFVPPPDNSTNMKIYSNGQSRIHIKA